MVIQFVAELSESIYSLYIEQLISSFLYSTEAFQCPEVKIVDFCLYSWVTGVVLRKSLPQPIH